MGAVAAKVGLGRNNGCRTHDQYDAELEEGGY